MSLRSSLLLLLWLAVASGLSSCATGRQLSSKPLPREVTFWKPWLLFSSDSRYSSIYVEVDAVQGSEPPQAWLDSLQRYLSTQCRKPGGVRVVRSNVIPALDAATSTQTSLALKYIDGPPAGSAFLYVLYYNSALNTGMRRTNPHAVVFPYPCAIFIDRSYNTKAFGDSVGDLILVHEAGHLTGAARSTTHGDGAHCADRKCIMAPAFEYTPAPKGSNRPVTKQTEFCKDCLADLSRSRSTPAPGNLSFAGPMLARQESGYTVFSLPNCVHLHLGSRESFPEAKIMDAIRQAGTGLMRSKDGFVISLSADGDTASVTRAMEAAEKDPATAVRTAAGIMRKRLETGKFAPPPGGTVLPVRS